MTDVRFDDATAFITGGAQGIGYGIAQSLAKRGVRLAIVDIDADKLREAQSSLGALTPTETYVLDVRDRTAYAAIADEVEAALGPVSLLFNNAGVAGGGAITSMSYETWDWFLDINVKGVINGLQTFLPRMIERGDGGYIVNTASGAGLVGQSSSYLYATTKFAVVGLSESLYPELRKYGIGVSVLCPGPVATTILSNTAKQQRDTGATENILDERYIVAGNANLAQGVAPEAVGEMVVDAMEHNRLYIHTDDIMLEPLRARTEMILAALPSVLSGAMELPTASAPGGGSTASDGTVDGSYQLLLERPPNKPTAMTLTLTTTDGALTGSMSTGSGGGPILEPSLEGTGLSFKVKVDDPLPLTLQFDAIILGDVISGTASVGSSISLNFTGNRI